MIRNLFALTLLFVLTLAGCESPMSSEFHAAEAGELFQLSIPSNFKTTDKLHEMANFQAEDDQNGFFLLGIREDKDELRQMKLRYSLQDYAWFVERQLVQGIDTTTFTRFPSSEINGLKTERFSFEGRRQGENGQTNLWMRACIIESPDAFYQIVGWTTAEKAHWMKPTMDIVECSFKEIHPETPGTHQAQGGAESAVI